MTNPTLAPATVNFETVVLQGDAHYTYTPTELLVSTAQALADAEGCGPALRSWLGA